MAHILTVADSPNGHYAALQESARRYGYYTLDVDHERRGHSWKITPPLQRACDSGDDVVAFVGAFAVVINAPPRTPLREYHALATATGRRRMFVSTQRAAKGDYNGARL